MNIVEVKHLIKYIEESLLERKRFSLDPKDQKFFNSIKSDVRKGVERYSEKQRKWLNDIYIKVQSSGGYQGRERI